MGNLTVHNEELISYSDDILEIHVLGALDLNQMASMYCTLRIDFQNYPPLRKRLNLYNGSEVDRLTRELSHRWSIKYEDCLDSIEKMVDQLEKYKIKQNKNPQSQGKTSFYMNEEEEKQAEKYLSSKKLITNLQKDLSAIGIIGEETNATIMFLSMASRMSNNPFSVIGVANNGTGKSYLLNKLAACLSEEKISLHTKLSQNAAYYLKNEQVQNKVFFIEDLDCTKKELNALSRLQSQSHLVKTRTVKDMIGGYQTVSYGPYSDLCMLACADYSNNPEQYNLPFLTLNLNQGVLHDQKIIDYQKKERAGLIDEYEVAKIQTKLKCVLSSLEKVKVINPYAPLIDLPEGMANKPRTLNLLFDFMEVITFFFQKQRMAVDEITGEILHYETHPDDIELAFNLLRESMLRKSDELKKSVRSFYDWLKNYLEKKGTEEFYSSEVRKVNKIKPKTLNNYLNELKNYNYVEIIGGNKNREGHHYKIIKSKEFENIQKGMQEHFSLIIKAVRAEYSRPVGKRALSDSQTQAT